MDKAAKISVGQSRLPQDFWVEVGQFANSDWLWQNERGSVLDLELGAAQISKVPFSLIKLAATIPSSTSPSTTNRIIYLSDSDV